jgi:3-deoxy-D-manno-octulosonic-acid transferase
VAHWRPDLVLWSESELWPSLLGAVARGGIPLLLLNGRMSVRSYRRWQRLPGAIGTLFGSFQLCLGQTPQDAERFKTLGAPAVDCLGNLKFAAPVLPVDATVMEDMRAAMAGRVRWLAASTHPGEEASVAAAHRLLAAGVPGLLTLLVPRHPARGAAIAEELRAAGLTVARRAAGETLTPATEVYLADTIGELGLWYRLAPVAFVGGSLVPRGGQNPLEPARLGVAVLHGPHMENFAEIAGGLAQAGGSRQVADAAALAAMVRRLCVDDPVARAAMAAAARRYADSQALVLDRLFDRLAPWLDALAAFQPADDCQAAEKYRH